MASSCLWRCWWVLRAVIYGSGGTLQSPMHYLSLKLSRKCHLQSLLTDWSTLFYFFTYVFLIRICSIHSDTQTSVLRGNVWENQRGAPTCRNNLCSYSGYQKYSWIQGPWAIDSFTMQTLSIHCILKFLDLFGFLRHYLLIELPTAAVIVMTSTIICLLTTTRGR